MYTLWRNNCLLLQQFIKNDNITKTYKIHKDTVYEI